MQEDPVAQKQKALHQVKLAIRRVRSQMARKRSLGDSPIGNSLILAKAGLSLIRGSTDVNLGWDETPRRASLLCFDEVGNQSQAIPFPPCIGGQFDLQLCKKG